MRNRPVLQMLMIGIGILILFTSVFIDVRDRSEYEETRIPGSLSIPLVQLESQQKELDLMLGSLPTVPDHRKNRALVRREFSWITASRKLPLSLVIFESGRTPVTRWNQVINIA